MPSARTANKPGHITTGNVLEDLGFSPLEIREMEIKHDLWVPIRAEIEARKLTQSQLAKLLEIHQPDASLLLRGQITRFSITRLLEFAGRLRLAVTFCVTPMTDAQKVPDPARIPMRTAKPRNRPAKAAPVRSARRIAQA
jgi:predicted XRE-type DNA-binding protein